MACGYNGARLHQKVFEPRFLYWADKLGYLVWGEFPNWGYNNKPEGYAAYVTEWTEVLLRDRNHPAIIGWCPFNETGAGAAEIQQLIWNVTKAVDPTRPVLESSGWAHTLPHPEVRDAHDYDGNPANLRKRWMDYFAGASGRAPRFGLPADTGRDCGVPFMISEIGGIGWATEGGWGYGEGPEDPRSLLHPLPGHARRPLGQPEPVRILLHATDGRRAGAQRLVLLRPAAEVRREADLRDHVAKGGLRARGSEGAASGLRRGTPLMTSFKHTAGVKQAGVLRK